ncbi:MAG: cupredoxin domain-containing protein [Steroidobacteraceae bacterium]
MKQLEPINLMRRTIVLLALSALALPVLAANAPSYSLDISEHAFIPATLAIPAGTRVKLLVKNTRRLPSEFESFDLNREKVVPPGTTITVWIGPLAVGKYKFFDDFNPAATGRIIAATPGGGARP